VSWALFSYTWAVFQIELLASGLSLSSESQSNAADKRLLDILRQGLATEFPNPERIGCPGNALLKGIAQGKVSLTEAEPWLDHLGSCSPCFQEFKEFRRQSAIQRRRVLTWVATAAVLLFAVGGWLWVRARHSVETTDVAVLDLRERSVARGQSQSEAVRHLWKFLERPSTWFLIFRLGARKDPTMSVCSLTRATSSCARRGWRTA
jgi:hypothetical protein